MLLDDTGTEQRALAPAYKLVANADGVTFLPYLGPTEPAAPVRLRLRSVRRGERDLPLRTPASRLSAGTLHIDHGCVEERWHLGKNAAEQTFTCADLGVQLLLAGLPATATPLCANAPSCRLGVQIPALALVPGNSLPIVVPTDLALVGAQLAVQGVALGVQGACDPSLLGLPFAVGDTVVMTVR